MAPGDVGRFGPSLVLARLYEKTSARGSQYFVGRLGQVKIAILKSREISDSGDQVWEVVVSQAAAPQLKPAEPAARTFRAPERRLRKRASGGVLPNDGIDDLWAGEP